MLDPVGSSLKDLWTPTLAYYTAYEISDFAEVLKAVAGHVLQTSNEFVANSKKLKSVATKYSHKKFGKISMLPQLRSEIVQEMAEE